MPTNLDDRKGCELCSNNYITFTKYPTDQGSKDICSSCHQKQCDKLGKPSGGYPSSRRSRTFARRHGIR